MNSIDLVGIGKAYKSYPRKWGRAAEWLGYPAQHALHWVLKDVDLEISPGESVGIIGMNGAGKSTLLKIIAGVTRPTTGTVSRAGRLAALLELGMGFHPDFPGRQNVYMAGQLQGLSAEEIHRSMPSIEAFAEIGAYIDEPIRTYSSGMQVRLAFSVATAVRPDILIVDEALAVGDIFFQQKCYERLAEFRRLGTTLLFVSHAIGAVLQLCDRAIFLRQGQVEYDGSPKEATDLYQAGALVMLDKRREELRVARPLDGGTTATSDGAIAAGSVRTDSATLSGVRLFDADGKESTVLAADAPARLEIRYLLTREVDDPHIGFKIRNKFGTVLFETNSYCMRESLGKSPSGSELIASFEFRAVLATGEYTVTVGLANRGFAEGSFEEALSYQHEVLAFSVARMSSSFAWLGLVNLEPTLSVERRPAIHG